MEIKSEAQEGGAVVPLSVASFELKMPWHKAHRLLLSGELEGVRRGANWFVTRTSLEKLQGAAGR